MKSIILSLAASLLVVTLLTSVGQFANTSFAQGNQTNQSGGGGQQNQSGIGTASQMENLTSDNMNQTGEAGQSAINQTGEAAQTALNETGEALTNASEGLKGLGEGNK